MQKFLADFIKRLTSRKFLLTVASCLVLYANGQYDQITWVVLAYLGVEGAGDAAERYTTPKQKAADAELQSTKLQILGADALPDTGVDKNIFVPGASNGQ